MLTSYQILQWLKTLCSTKSINLLNFYCGTLDNKQLNSLGVYTNISNDVSPFIAIGGLNETPTNDLGVCLLIHYNKNYKQTEEESIKLFNALLELNDFIIDGHAVNYINLLVDYPKDVGTDDNGVYERVINLNVNYKK